MCLVCGFGLLFVGVRSHVVGLYCLMFVYCCSFVGFVFLYCSSLLSERDPSFTIMLAGLCPCDTVVRGTRAVGSHLFVVPLWLFVCWLGCLCRVAFFVSLLVCVFVGSWLSARVLLFACVLVSLLFFVCCWLVDVVGWLVGWLTLMLLVG